MRRIASIFKRSSKSEAGSTTVDSESPPSAPRKAPGFFRSLSTRSLAKQPLSASTPPPVPLIPQAYSSSSSSSDSPSLPTPDDENPPYVSTPNTPWSGSTPGKKPILLDTSSFGWDARSSFKSYVRTSRAEDSEDDRSSATSSSRSESTSSSIPRSVAPIAYAHSLTTNNLAPSFSIPPLLNLPGNPLFPRSCNPVASLLYSESTESTLHRTRLLRRLERRELSSSEEASLAPFASRRSNPAKRVAAIRSDDDAVRDAKRISRVSRGLKAWVARPCFEDRMEVYTPAPPGSSEVAVKSHVIGSSFAVPELELSPGLEALSGLTMDVEDTDEPWLASAGSSSSSLSLSPAPSSVQARTQQYRPSPSPLRLETVPASPSASSAGIKSAGLQAEIPSPVSPSAFSNGPRRVRNSVRFDVEDKEDRDDEVPLGQIFHIKRGRAEKSKFLQAERERRAHEQERARHEMERLKWEKEKEAWEAEKRAIEQDRKQKQYAEEVLAARKRREAQTYTNHGSSPELSDLAQFTRHSTTTYLRPQYDARTQSSEPGPYLPPSRNESPASSRGTSRTRVDSRPPSIHSSHTLSSVEDVRLRERRGGSSKRASQLSGSPKDFVMQPQFVPYAWVAVPPVPALPYMPFYPTNMDLLPPTAPFMMQGSRRSSSSSRESLSRASQSAERLPQPQRQSAHQRHSSGEIPSNKRVSMSSRSPSSPAIASLKEGNKSSRSAAPQGQTPRSSLNPSPNTRPSLPQTFRRQTAIT